MPFVAHRTFGWTPFEINESHGLQTIPNGMVYSICNSLFCCNCKLLFLDIRFSETELANLYNNYRGDEYVTLRNYYEPGYTQRNKLLNSSERLIDKIEFFLAPLISFPLTTLDWGGGSGKNTPFQNQENDIDIYDIDDNPVIGHAKHINKQTAFSKRYDLVVCSHVLEHIPYPLDTILEIKNTMDESSTLYIEVPYEDIVQFEQPDIHIKKNHWHEHINFFSPDSLRKLLENCGLSIIKMEMTNLDPNAKSRAWVFQIACRLKVNDAHTKSVQ